MVFAVATFLIALAVIFGSYWLLVARPEIILKSAAVGRLRALRVARHAESVVAEQRRMSSIEALDKVLGRRGAAMAGVERTLMESGLSLTVGALLMVTVVCALAGFVAGVMATGVFAVALALAVLCAALPMLYVRHRRAVRLRLFEEQFPEAIDLISRALRAGHALTTGLGMVAEEIPAPVGAEFRRLYDEQNFGMSLPDAMRAMAQRVPVLDARFFVTAVLTQRESGGNLSEVLDNLASVMRERFKLKRQIRVISAHGRISAWVLSGLPPVLAAVLFVLSPDFMRVLWEDPLGLRLVMIAVTLQIIGTVVISRLVRIEY